MVHVSIPSIRIICTEVSVIPFTRLINGAILHHQTQVEHVRWFMINKNIRVLILLIIQNKAAFHRAASIALRGQWLTSHYRLHMLTPVWSVVTYIMKMSDTL